MNRGQTKSNNSGRFTLRFISVDILLIPLSLLGAFLLRFDFQIPIEVYDLFKHYIPILLFLKLSSFAGFGLYRGMWRYTSISDLINIIKASSMETLLTISVFALIHGFTGFPKTVLFIDFTLCTILLWLSRASVRL